VKSKSPSSLWRQWLPETLTWFSRKYTWSLFRADLLAGITVGVIALPLGMAFAIASGLSPDRGIYTTIIAGFLISLLGGSRYQIGGATGAFVVIIYGIVQNIGYDGLVIVTLMAGLLLLIASLCQLGNLIKYIPYPLITGFTTGIAVIIFSSQVKDFLGLTLPNLPADFLPKWGVILHNIHAVHVPTCMLATITLLFILFIRRYCPRLPWGIAAVVMATVVAWAAQLPVATIATQFGQIPRSLPLPAWPTFSFSFASIHELIPDAITVAFLAGIESLLASVVADGMTGTRHRPNCELMGQGLSNIASVCFGGIPATGALARTAANIKTGGQTPFAGMIHAFTVMGIVWFCAPLVSMIPLAALAAVLMIVAWNMSELHHFRHLLRAPLSDIVILLITFFLTVLVDLTTAVLAGVLLALFLFMKKMETQSKVNQIAREAWPTEHLSTHVEVYEITGPFFFGVADSLKHILSHLEKPPKFFVLQVTQVPWMDASGMHALREFYHTCTREGTTLILASVQPSLEKTLKKFKVVELIGDKHIFAHTKAAFHYIEKVCQH